jgi:hypothetical protein
MWLFSALLVLCICALTWETVRIHRRIDNIKSLAPSGVLDRFAAVERVNAQQDRSLRNHRMALEEQGKRLAERPVNFRYITVGRSRITVPCDATVEQIDKAVRRAFGVGKQWTHSPCVTVPLRAVSRGDSL